MSRTLAARGALALATVASLSGAPSLAQPSGPSPAPQPADSRPTDAGLAATGPTRRILLPPPTQWDRAMLTNKPALQQTATDFTNMTGGFAFGMTPTEVNARLPDPSPGLSWSALPLASEYPGEVRYFWARLDSAGPLRVGVAHCAGAGSYVAFLFSSRGLFRLSYRMAPDKACASAADAARDILARYVTLGATVALSARYRAGQVEVVDVTDPTAGYLVPVRYRVGGL